MDTGRGDTVFADPNDEATIEAALRAQTVHPDEVNRLLALGRVDETVGAELLAVAQQGWPDAWLMNDPDDATVRTTRCAHADAIALERLVAAGIGAAGVSCYRRLFVGCTRVDADLAADVVHVNVLSEDMRFAALGPRILIDGSSVPLPDGLMDSCEGMHIPVFLPDTELLLQEVFRVLKYGGELVYAPSSDEQLVWQILVRVGFDNVRQRGVARSTFYRGGRTRPRPILQATKPTGAIP